jgi:hypothetical protein
MLGARRKRLVGALEYMRGSVDDAFNAYHEGTQNAVQSKLRLWADLADVLQRLDEKAFAEVGWLRVELPHDGATAGVLTKLLGDALLTVRYVGPREGGAPAVAYVTVRAGSAHDVARLVEAVLARGFPVRDWSFGCQQGGSK